MKDKIYTELNRNKPDREVLSKAYREMGVPEKSKKHSARTIIKWASACACSMLVIIVAVIVLPLPPSVLPLIHIMEMPEKHIVFALYLMTEIL